MKFLLSFAFVFLSAVASHGASSVSPWVPIFQGIDQATGTNDAGSAGPLSANALRVDLQNPNIRIAITPPITNNYIPDQRETFAQTPREFVTEQGLQVGINSGAYFAPNDYGMASGTPVRNEGVAISSGRLVSTQTSSNESLSAILFATNNQPTFVPVNWPPADTAGIYNAVSGYYPIVINGTNISFAYTGLGGVHSIQPRTAFGLSQDNRYLILMTIDGRQGFSVGALDSETADLLILFGAWNGINVDGGGSTCMVKANECGVPIDINHNSFQEAVGRPGSQRAIGCSLGISALPLPGVIDNVTVIPGSTTAIITWQTDEEATTQVEYGPTAAYGSATPLDESPRKFHIATLSGLSSGGTYFYRAVSLTASQGYSRACSFSTTNAVSRELVFPMTTSWKYSTNNLDGIDWKTLNYDENGWAGPSPACLHIESSTGPQFAPQNTVLPPGFVVPIFRTYYFRTPFLFSGVAAGGSLTFSNYIDDGAIFYLNGAELTRIRMPPPPTFNATFASGRPCVGTQFEGDAATICPDIFTVGGTMMTNLYQGTNIVAVEVHNISGGTSSQDIFFGSALFVNRPSTVPPKLFINAEAGASTLYWNGEGFTLQQSSDLSSTNNWSDVPGPVTQSPFTTPNIEAAFYRLRQ